MKKITLAFALLTVACIFLYSFSTTTVSQKVQPAQTQYYWIKYNCQPQSTAQPITVSCGVNFLTGTQTGYPYGGGCYPYTLFNGCGSSGTNICAVRLVAGEFEAIPGYNGQIRPKASVNPYDGNHMIAYCN